MHGVPNPISLGTTPAFCIYLVVFFVKQGVCPLNNLNLDFWLPVILCLNTNFKKVIKHNSHKVGIETIWTKQNYSFMKFLSLWTWHLKALINKVYLLLILRSMRYFIIEKCRGTYISLVYINIYVCLSKYTEIFLIAGTGHEYLLSTYTLVLNAQ